MQVSSLQEELQSGSNRRQELERQVQSSEGRQRELERQVEEGERSRQEMQGAAQQGKAAEVQVKALQARLAQATQAAATIGQDLAQARTQVLVLSQCLWGSFLEWQEEGVSLFSYALCVAAFAGQDLAEKICTLVSFLQIPAKGEGGEVPGVW